ncbi:MAG: GNAT family N-acetyltransferase [Proteobacteria bacterium]|nr:GNAT family N-acetyltransferase [Pseudomonadota bacterium]
MRPVTPCAAAVAEALLPDPFYLAVTVDHADDAARRLAVLGAYVDQALDEAPSVGFCTRAQPDQAGAAIWHLPQPPDVVARADAAKRAQLAALLGPRGLANYRAIVDFMAPHAARAVAPGAWYLSIIGVAPSQQGRGLGAQLLAAALSRATTQGRACYLETFTPRNLPFYERLGFRPLAMHREPVTGADYWILLRS